MQINDAIIRAKFIVTRKKIRAQLKIRIINRNFARMPTTLSTEDGQENGDTMKVSTQEPHDELQYINLIKQILAKGRSRLQSIQFDQF